jgi:LytS/YehU family sensor histidine kinase
LRVVEEVDDEALECGIPALTLQPLVENAVRHGVAPRAAGGTVLLRARVDDGGFLEVEVGDDGPGARPADVAAATGVGIDVVRRRLGARHGGDGTLAVLTAPGEGFVARVRVPGRPAPVRRPAPPPALAREASRGGVGVPA